MCTNVHTHSYIHKTHTFPVEWRKVLTFEIRWTLSVCDSVNFKQGPKVKLPSKRFVAELIELKRRPGGNSLKSGTRIRTVFHYAFCSIVTTRIRMLSKKGCSSIIFWSIRILWGAILSAAVQPTFKQWCSTLPIEQLSAAPFFWEFSVKSLLLFLD